MAEASHVFVGAGAFTHHWVDAQIKTVLATKQPVDSSAGFEAGQPLVAGEDVDTTMFGHGAGFALGNHTRRERDDVIGRETGA